MTKDPDPTRGGQGESGPEENLRTRAETEEAAATGRFPDDDGTLRDDSNPVERESHPLDEEQPGVVSGARSAHSHDTNPSQSDGAFDEGVATEHLRSPSQGSRPG